MEAEITKCELLVSQVKVSNVVVFSDIATSRAEITRTYPFKVTKDTTSVRVNCLHNAATIAEVSTQKMEFKEFETKDLPETKELKVIKSAMDVIQKKVNKNKTSLGRIEKEQEKLTKWSVSQTELTPKDGIITPSIIEGADSFLTFYGAQLTKFDERRDVLSDELEVLNGENEELLTKKRELEKEIEKKKKDYNDNYRKGNQKIIVLVLSEKVQEVQLSIIYLASGANWSAHYDARVNLSEGNIQLTYFGNITNSTDEDWVETNISLSTASPSALGAPPVALTTMHVSLTNKIEYGPSVSSSSNPLYASSGNENPLHSGTSQQTFSGPSGRGRANVHSNDRSLNIWSAARRDDGERTRGGHYRGDDSESHLLEEDLDNKKFKEQMKKENFSFLIPRLVTIQSDDKPHKVTLTTLQLVGEFEYTIAPKLSTEAYLKAKVTNDSQYILLSGPLSIFIDGNFIAKSSIGNIVHSSESFAIFLGSDQGIKTLYFEEKNNKNQTGVFNKVSNMELSSKIYITNNKNKAITVIVFEQLPKSDNELLKVNLVEPKDAKHFDTLQNIDLSLPVLVTPQNNIRWTRVLKPGDNVALKFSCTFEYPADKDIKYHKI